MSKGVLINTLDTYIGTALYEELLGEDPEQSSYDIYGTWHNKDDSFKPKNIKKMMKVVCIIFISFFREANQGYLESI
jgi:hypothetical protein